MIDGLREWMERYWTAWCELKKLWVCACVCKVGASIFKSSDLLQFG